MKQKAVEREILELLANELELDVEDLEAELRAKGTELPIDSLLMVEIILAVEERFEIHLPDDTATADALRSVRALAQRICEVAVSVHPKEKSR